LPEGPLQSIAAIRDDCGQPIWFPQGVWHLPGEDLERVGTAVAALLGRADQVRKRDLTLPDDVTIFQGPRGAPVANVHDQHAIAAGQYLIGDIGILPDVPEVEADAEAGVVNRDHDLHGLLQRPDRALHVHQYRAQGLQRYACAVLQGVLSQGTPLSDGRLHDLLDVAA
jgi:hypothetical protein